MSQKSLVSMFGKSGSGKSSLARFLEENLNNCVYISQKLPKGNAKSSIATYLEANKIIKSHFANFSKKIYRIL
ncbi:hypothetical protein [Helicobacter muridarum]|uniref:hypothetical protein n=1 Tax=Helicobacter muridarum TaxID=216 RepID=UPI00051F8D94|nr:hypothetical protein [Helicobacter muridarum]